MKYKALRSLLLALKAKRSSPWSLLDWEIKSFLIIFLDSILPKGLDIDLPIGGHSKNHFFSPRHHSPNKVATKQFRSPSLDCTSVSSRSPPNLKKFRRWDCEISQALALRSNFAMVFPRLVPHRINFTPLSENYCFHPFPFLVWVKIIIGC